MSEILPRLRESTLPLCLVAGDVIEHLEEQVMDLKQQLAEMESLVREARRPAPLTVSCSPPQSAYDEYLRQCRKQDAETERLIRKVKGGTQ